jgi:endonuclease/exonuclease/phosphatase family metal-dependent hydrolase
VSDAHLCFASFNIRTPLLLDGANRWSKRKGLVADVIRDVLQPDVIGLQECTIEQATFLADAMPKYDWVGVGRSDGRQRGEMVPIFYKRDRVEQLDACHFWLSTRPDQPGSRSWLSSFPRMVTWARFKASGKEFAFFNTHFDHISTRARRESAKLLLERVTDVHADGATPCIVAGDFNDVPASQPHEILTSTVLGDPAPEDAAGTYHRFTGNATRRIDWLLATSEWGELTYRLDTTSRDGRWPSDHHAITLEASLV